MDKEEEAKKNHFILFYSGNPRHVHWQVLQDIKSISNSNNKNITYSIGERSFRQKAEKNYEPINVDGDVNESKSRNIIEENQDIHQKDMFII